VIAVDSSALMAIVLDEGQASACAEALARSDPLIMSALTYAEVMIVAQGRGCGEVIRQLIEALAIEIMPVDETTAEQAAYAYQVWGKGRHRASLNPGDCFSYVLAKTHDCPLLYIGNDFSQTDIKSAL